MDFAAEPTTASTHLVVLNKTCYYAEAPGLTNQDVARRFAEQYGPKVTKDYEIASIRRLDDLRHVDHFAFGQQPWIFTWH